MAKRPVHGRIHARWIARRTGAGVPDIGRLAVYVVLIAWSAICLLPVLWMVVTSLKGAGDIDNGPFYLPFVDFAPTLESWRFILDDPYDGIVPRLANSLVVSTAATLLCVTIGGLAVYAATRLRPTLPLAASIGGGLAALCAAVALVAPVATGALAAALGAGLFVLVSGRMRGSRMALGPGMFLALALATRALPPVVIVLPLYLGALQIGLLDTRFALTLVYAATNLPVAFWLLRPVLGASACPAEEAALLDGASHLEIAFSILAPMVFGGIAAVAVIVFVLCWNEYLFAVYLTTDRAMTLPPFLVGQMSMKEAQTGSEAEEWARFSAATLVTIVPPLLAAIPLTRAVGWLTRSGGGREDRQSDQTKR